MNRFTRLLSLFAIASFGCGGGSQKGDADAAPTPMADGATVDTMAPAAVMNFAATLNEGTGAVDLSWTNPDDADFAGVVLVRSPAASSGGAPTMDTAVDDSVGTGTAIFNEMAEVTSDSMPNPGIVVYQIWAYDADGNVSESVQTQVVAPIPAQSASIQIDPVNLTMTIPTTPEFFGLSGTVENKRASYLHRPEFGSGLRFTAVALGAAGNGATIAIAGGADPMMAPVIITNGTNISVQYAPDTHTSRDIAAAVNADANASLIMQAEAIADGLEISSTNGSTLAGGSDEIVVAHLELANTGVSRLVFNSKALVSTISVGTATAAGDLNGTAAVWFGPRGLEMGGQAGSGYLEVTGHGDATIDLALDLQDDPSIFVPARRDSDLYLSVDSSGSGAYAFGTGGALEYGGAFNEYPGTRAAVVSPDSRFLIAGSRTMPSVNLVDLTTMEPVLGVDVSDGTGVGSVETVKLSPDGTVLYALVNHGRHASAFYSLEELAEEGHICKLGDFTCLSTAPTAELIKLSYPALEIQERLTLFATSAVDARARDLEMSADGTVGAIPFVNAGAVAIVDLAAMSILSEVDVSAVNLAPRQVAVSPDGSKTYVGYRSGNNPAAGEEINHDGSISVIDNTSFAITSLTPPDMILGQSVGAFDFGPDGKLYLGRKQQITPTPMVVYDPTEESWASIDFEAGQSYLMVFAPDGQTAFDYNADGNPEIRKIDLASGTHQVLTTLPSGNGHLMTMTPY